jgi:hypothetical protein
MGRGPAERQVPHRRGVGLFSQSERSTAAGDSSERVCRVCGDSLEGRRRQARYCDGLCRAEAARIRAILEGSSRAPYPSLDQRVRAARKRTGARWWFDTDAAGSEDAELDRIRAKSGRPLEGK